MTSLIISSFLPLCVLGMALHIKNELTKGYKDDSVVNKNLLFLQRTSLVPSTHINHVITALGEPMPLLRLHDHTSMAGDYTENTGTDAL